MARVTVWFHGSGSNQGPAFTRVEDVQGTVEELTKTFCDYIQNADSKTLVLARTNGAMIVQKQHVLMIEVDPDTQD